MGKYLFIALLCASSAWSKPFVVGQAQFVFVDTHRGRKITTHVWYPAGAHEKVTVLKERSPFIPIAVAIEVPLAQSKTLFPVVLLSHGSMGVAKRLFWLAESLAKNGVIVIAVDHPGNMTGDSSADGLARVWDRAKDLTLALDKLMKEPAFKTRLDTNKVAAAGHSVGGTTVLLLGGAKFSAAKFSNPAPHCAGSKDPYYRRQCDGLQALDFKKFPKQLVEGDYRDPRVKAVLALDPGFVRSFQKQTLKAIPASALLFVADKLSTPQDEIYSKEFKESLPPNTVTVVPKSYHMSFMNACKPGLSVKNDVELQILCLGNKDKFRIQKDIAKKGLAFFQKHWRG